MDFQPEIDADSSEGAILKEVRGQVDFKDIHLQHTARPGVRVMRVFILTVLLGITPGFPLRALLPLAPMRLDTLFASIAAPGDAKTHAANLAIALGGQQWMSRDRAGPCHYSNTYHVFVQNIN